MLFTELGFTALGNIGYRKLVLWEVCVWMMGRGRREVFVVFRGGGIGDFEIKVVRDFFWGDFIVCYLSFFFI